MAKPKTKPFGFFQNFPNLNRTERFRFGLNPVCIGLKPNFPNTMSYTYHLSPTMDLHTWEWEGSGPMSHPRDTQMCPVSRQEGNREREWNTDSRRTARERVMK